MSTCAKLEPAPKIIEISLESEFCKWLLLEKIKAPEIRKWYAHEVLHNGWSGRALEEAIRSNLHKRKGKAITNFEERLPAPHSQLANDILKSPYNFGFLTLEDDYPEYAGKLNFYLAADRTSRQG